MSAVTIARATMDAQAREKASMSAVARDVGRGQERLAAFRVARCQNGDHSVTGPASGIPGRTEQTQGSDDLVFTSARGTALYDSNIRKHWHRVSSNLGLAPMPWHNLRHSAATIMLAQGVPIEVVSRVFGHASIRITADIYGHVSPETNRQAADAMAKALR